MSLSWAQVSGVEVAERWVSMATWSEAMATAVMVIGVVVLVLTLLNVRSLRSRRRQSAIVLLRALLVACLLGVFFQPALLVEKRAHEPSHVLVLLDSSASMSLAQGGPDSPSRSEGLSTFLAQQGEHIEALAEHHTMHIHSFDARVDVLDSLPRDGATDGLEASGGATRLMAALKLLRERHRGEHLAAIIALTDGIDTDEGNEGANLSVESRRILESLEAPLHVVVPAPHEGLRDVSVSDLGTSGFAFLMNATSVEARIQARGLVGVELELELLLDDQIVAQRQLTPTRAHEEQTVRLDFVPRRLGEQVLTLRARPVDGEVHLGNNTAQRPIQVIRDRVRVLQIVGQPSWDERFLRHHLKEDPNVELISFFILVNPLSLRPLDAADTALIPFPARELFEEELGGFDLVIFQNFNYGPFQTRQYLPHIARYVREGGAFLMIGGPLSLASGGYYGTPITDVLPVTIPAGFGDQRLIDTTRFEAQLTPAGSHHPAILLAEDPDEHAALWRGLEPLQGVNIVTGIQPDAVVLATHPTLRDDRGEPMPVIALREVERGRTMVVATDSTWRWKFVAGNRGEDTHGYTRLWASAIRWLIRDPAMSPIQVDVVGDMHELAAPGEPVSQATARVVVVRPDYLAAADQPVDVVARRRAPGGAVGEGEILMALDQARTDDKGHLEVSIPLTHHGVIEVSVSTRVSGGRSVEASDLFVVTGAATETERTLPDPEWLAALAQKTGGSVQTFSTADPSFPTSPPQARATLSRHHDEVWTSPWVLLLVVSLASTEWALRRRWGLL